MIKILDFIGQIVNKTAKEILKYTPQLYTKLPGENENIVPEANASGVLLFIDGQHFLITAGHILEDHKPEDIGIMIGNVFNILNGLVKYVRPSTSELADKIDIAVWRLDEEVAETLKTSYKFLPFERIDYNHKIDSDPKYLFVGFPWKKTKPNYKERKLLVEPLIFLTKESKRSEYKRLKYERHLNLLLDYRQKKVKDFSTGNIQQQTSPQGISGCGVWYIPKFLNPFQGVPDFKLVGQIIEQTKEKTILIATRIHLVTEVLRRDFGLNIPQSNVTHLK